MSRLFAQIQTHLTIFNTNDFYHYRLEWYSKEFKYEIP